MRVDSWAKGLFVPAICLVLLGVFSIPSHATEFKAGKISLSDVYRTSAKVKNAMQELKKMQLDAEAQTVPLKEQIGKIHEKLKSAEPPLPQEEKEKLQTQLKEKVQEIENIQQAVNAKLSFKQKSIQNSFLNQIKEVFQKLGEKNGLNAIFGSEMLLYSKDVTDLTAEAVKELEALPPFESSKP
jgi:Skp family chaperone for outer membrane proteins